MSIKTKIRVHFYNTDEMGVVHHANYIRWFETGRVEYLRAAGISLNDLIADGFLFPITEIKVKYLHSAKFDDELELETIARELTKVKMEFNYKIRRVNDGKVLCEGFSQNVFTNAATGKITRLTAKFADKLAAAMDSEVVNV